MRVLGLLALGSLAIVVESLFASSWNWNGARPSLFPWLLACAAVVPADRTAAPHYLFAMVLGVMLDLLGVGAAGPRTIACVATVWLLVQLRRGEGDSANGGVLVAIFMTAVVLQIADVAAISLAAGPIPSGEALFAGIAGNALCSAGLGFAIWQLGRFAPEQPRPVESMAHPNRYAVCSPLRSANR